MTLILIGYNIHLKAPIMTYGEKVSITIQNFILITLYWKYHPQTKLIQVLLASISFFSLIVAILADFIPSIVYESIIIINIVASIASTFSQAFMNWQNKNTGQLALIPLLLAFIGTIARVFTTLQEFNDSLLLVNSAVGTILTSILIVQILIYWNNTKIYEETYKMSNHFEFKTD